MPTLHIQKGYRHANDKYVQLAQWRKIHDDMQMASMSKVHAHQCGIFSWKAAVTDHT